MQVIFSSGPQTTPAIPPVSNLLDHVGQPIRLDRDIILTRLRGMTLSHGRKGLASRARIISIGDEGLPGRDVIGIRPHGSTYRESARPRDIEVHQFDDADWVMAETDAATEMCDERYRHGRWAEFQRHGADLTKVLFGGFWFEPFQELTMSYYLKRIGREA